MDRPVVGKVTFGSAQEEVDDLNRRLRTAHSIQKLITKSMAQKPVEHDVARLPKWVQDKIVALELTVQRLKKERQVVDAGETDTFIDDYVNDVVALPPHSGIRFITQGGAVRVYVNKEGVLDVNSVDGNIHVLPRAANHIYIAVQKRF